MDAFISEEINVGNSMLSQMMLAEVRVGIQFTRRTLLEGEGYYVRFTSENLLLTGLTKPDSDSSSLSVY